MLRSEVPRRPTLLESCARAATAAEARFRITYPFLPRDSRIVALDEGAARVICGAADRHWSGAHFLAFESATPPEGNGSGIEATLRRCDGSETLLSQELSDADVTVMVASTDGWAAAAVIGQACAERGIMTAGVVLAEGGERVNDAVLALRPYAMVLVVSQDDEDLLALLTALRA
jgi:hypothetical protein